MDAGGELTKERARRRELSLEILHGGPAGGVSDRWSFFSGAAAGSLRSLQLNAVEIIVVDLVWFFGIYIMI